VRVDMGVRKKSRKRELESQVVVIRCLKIRIDASHRLHSLFPSWL